MPSQANTSWEDGPRGCSFFTKRWTPDSQPAKAKLIFVHGFMEHVSRYDHVFSRYADAGIEVFGFDQRGFGQTAAKTKTQGQTSWAHQFEDLDHFVRQEAATASVKVFVMGHSMGGGITFGYFTRPIAPSSVPLVTGGAILTSPLIKQTPAVATNGAIIRLGSFVGAVLPKLTLKVGVDPKDISRDPKVQEAYAADPLCAPIGTYKGIADMILGGGNLLSSDYKRFPPSLPLLAVQGTADRVTWYDATEKLMSKAPATDKTFKAFDGGYHELHNDIEPTQSEQIQCIIDWILAHS